MHTLIFFFIQRKKNRSVKGFNSFISIDVQVHRKFVKIGTYAIELIIYININININ